MTEDIEFCLHRECKNRKCERHPSNIRCWWFDHSFVDLKDTDFCKRQKAKRKGGVKNGSDKNDSDSDYNNRRNG